MDGKIELSSKIFTSQEFDIPAAAVTDTDNICFIREIPEFFKKTAAKTAIVALQNYNAEHIELKNELYGIIAPYARRNYYKELRKKLEKFVKYLKKSFGGNYFISVNGSIREKPLAHKSGIAVYGRNHITANERYGSFIVIGIIVTDIEFKIQTAKSISDKNLCSDCGLCIKHCPSGAIGKNGAFDRERCLQYLSQQPELNEAAADVWGHIFYGCSVCQDVCPKNKNTPLRSVLPEYGHIGGEIYLPEIIYLSDIEIKEKFKGSQLSASWIQPKALIKNALTVLARSEQGREYVNAFAAKGRPDMKTTAERLIQLNRKQPHICIF